MTKTMEEKKDGKIRGRVLRPKTHNRLTEKITLVAVTSETSEKQMSLNKYGHYRYRYK